MINILIVEAIESEKPWAAELMSKSEPWTVLGITLEQSINAVRDEGNLVFIARDRNVPCGVIILQDKGVAGSPYVKSVVVAPSYRNQGIGKLLITFAEDKYRNHYKHLFLCVSSFNKEAQRFYKESGYAAVGEFKDYIVDGLSEILMHKRLR